MHQRVGAPRSPPRGPAGPLLGGAIAFLGAWVLYKTQLDQLEGMVRAQTRKVSALVSAYYNHIDDYIAPEVVGDTVLTDEAGEFRVPLTRFGQEDATLVGIEGKVEVLAGIGRFGWATDPEGNRFELWEPEAPGS